MNHDFASFLIRVLINTNTDITELSTTKKREIVTQKVDDLNKNNVYKNSVNNRMTGDDLHKRKVILIVKQDGQSTSFYTF